MLSKREIPISVFLFTSPYPDTNLTTERRKIRQINKVNYRKLSINRFYLFSANCLNSTNLVQWHIVIALIINTNIPKAKIDVSLSIIKIHEFFL